MGKTRKMFNRKLRGITITKLMARDGTCCVLCAEEMDRHIKNSRDPDYITFDHIIPSADGGTDDIKNLQLAHQNCNRARGRDPILPENKDYEWLFWEPSAARMKS